MTSDGGLPAASGEATAFRAPEPDDEIPGDSHDPAVDAPAPDASAPPPGPHKPAPWTPNFTWADVFCVGPIVISIIYVLLGTQLPDRLIGSHPVLLIAVRPTIIALINAGALVNSHAIAPVVALLLPLPMLLYPDPFYFWAGRRYGRSFAEALIRADPTWEKRIARAQGAMNRFGVGAIYLCAMPFNPFPVTAVLFLAGSSKMRWRWFLLADLLGLMTVEVAELAIGFFLGEARAHPLVTTIAKWEAYISTVSLIAVGVLVVITMRRSLRAMREDGRLSAAGFEANPRRRMHAADWLVVIPIVAVIAYQFFLRGWATNAVGANHYAQIAVAGTLPILLGAGGLIRTGVLEFWPAALAAVPIVAFADPFFFWAGRRYGGAVAANYRRRNPAWDGRVTRIEAFFRRRGVEMIILCGIPIIPIPIAIIAFASGHIRMPLWIFLAADALSKAVFIGLPIAIGYMLGPDAQATISNITTIGSRILAAMIILVLLYMLIGIRRFQERQRRRSERTNRTPS